MSDNGAELARRWIRKAKNDLVTARQVLLLPDGPTDTAAFHAQQTVEKALKALLTFHGIPFTRTHDLVRLLDLAVPFLKDLERFREFFAELSGWAAGIRYPGDWDDPPRREVEEALNRAAEVLELVTRIVAGPAGGPTG